MSHIPSCYNCAFREQACRRFFKSPYGHCIHYLYPPVAVSMPPEELKEDWNFLRKSGPDGQGKYKWPTKLPTKVPKVCGDIPREPDACFGG